MSVSSCPIKVVVSPCAFDIFILSGFLSHFCDRVTVQTAEKEAIQKGTGQNVFPSALSDAFLFFLYVTGSPRPAYSARR
jgi:hypothetical protein